MYSFCSQKCFPKCGPMQRLLPGNAKELRKPLMEVKIWCNFRLQDHASDSHDKVVINSKKMDSKSNTHKKYQCKPNQLQYNKKNKKLKNLQLKLLQKRDNEINYVDKWEIMKRINIFLHEISNGLCRQEFVHHIYIFLANSFSILLFNSISILFLKLNVTDLIYIYEFSELFTETVFICIL